MLKETFLIFFICTLLTNDLVMAQKKTFDFGIFLGRSYYLGEINPSTHYGDDVGSGNIGAVLRYNLNNRYSLKATLIRTELSGDDEVADFNFNQNRNASFETGLTDLTAGIEFNFLPYEHGSRERFFSPYLFVGLSFAWFNPETFIDGQEVETEETNSQTTLALPFGPGFKLSLGKKVNLSFEWIFRTASSDYIDGLPNRINEVIEQGKDFDNDWYVHSGFMLTYRLTPIGNCPVYNF